MTSPSFCQSPEPSHVRFALVDDDPAYRETIGQSLGEYDELSWAGSFASGKEALASLPACRPDVVLVDIRMPDPDGITFITTIQPALPDTEFVMLTSFGGTDLIFGALRADENGPMQVG